jgi:hypothetical protein
MSLLKIAGVDISRNKISVCVLTEIPNLKYGKKPKIQTFEASEKGIKDFLSLDFDAAILEPTGWHYSRLWASHLERANRLVRWVGHWEVASYRESWKTFNKSDRLDAIALACYGLERWDMPWMFITSEHGEIRQLYLQLEHLNRVKTPMVNRLRQHLTHEFPEVSERVVKRYWLQPNPPGLWKAIAGEWSSKWKKEYDATIGLGLSTFSQGLAQQICQLETLEYQVEKEIELELQKPEFKPYLEVFDRYALTGRGSVALLSAIYPIDRFLRDGKPIIERVVTKNGKRATRNRSLAAFKLACGVGMTWYQSGNKEGWVPGGRSDIRTALWRWAKIAIVMHPKAWEAKGSDRVLAPALQELKDYYDNGSSQVIDGKIQHFAPGVRNQRIMRVVRRMLENLFRELTSIANNQ